MRTRSSSNLPVVSPSNPSISNPKHCNRRRSKQSFILEESPVDMMAGQRTMAELLRAPTEGTTNLRNEISNFQQRFDESFHEAWDRYKDLLRACPHHGFTELHQLDTFYNALNPADQDSLNAAAGGNLLKRRTQDVLTIIKNKSKVRNSRNESVVSQVKSCDANSNSSSEIAKLTHAVNQQTNVVTTAMTAILKQFQATPPPASVKAIEEICVTCGGALTTAVNYNQDNSGYCPPGSRSLPSNTVTNPKGKLKAITTRSGLVLDGPTVPTPSTIINPKEDERIEDTLTDPDLSMDPLHPNILYPSRMLKQKQQEKDEVQIHKFWQMFKQLHVNITLADALILMPKYQKMLKALLSNKKKLQELANMSLNENCSAVILKKLPVKLGDPGKFLISCGFSELKCKALADLGASINLMPLSAWKKLGLPELISTRMTLELANRAIFTPAGITRDVFVLVGKFTFPADFVIVDYESDHRVPLILERPFLRTARALIDVHGEEMILRDGDERLTLNMRHDTSSYFNQPQRESINLINVFNNSNLDSTKDLHPPLHDNPLSGSTTYSSSPNPLLEEFADELALITFPPKYDDDPQFDVESDLKEIEFSLHQDIDSSLKDSIDQKVESDAENVYDDPFDSKREKIKEVDALLSTNNEDKVFNPGILIQENLFEIITRVVQDKKLVISNASLVLEDFDPPFYDFSSKKFPGKD
uniref:Reverse transcriptase domain-containing protein n=1 Tax=Tanacetum cinerariifolium TaxID=118510 RepID=A0A6L2N3X1_TANCI|nr:reverse transcriptase domain-containing protein [Tanacetum cinerariifolium]